MRALSHAQHGAGQRRFRGRRSPALTKSSYDSRQLGRWFAAAARRPHRRQEYAPAHSSAGDFACRPPGCNELQRSTRATIPFKSVSSATVPDTCPNYTKLADTSLFCKHEAERHAESAFATRFCRYAIFEERSNVVHQKLVSYHPAARADLRAFRPELLGHFLALAYFPVGARRWWAVPSEPPR
jgi:hypothetical protein